MLIIITCRYNMRHTAQQISERFFLGSNDVARDAAKMQAMGITHMFVESKAVAREP